ncbi:MAG: hypothetical protein V4528_01065 [Pseudomonadota bacterium]
MILTLYVLLGLVIVASEVFRITRYRSVDALMLFNIAYFLFFVFVPLNVIILGEAAVRQKYVYQQFGYGDTSTAMALLACYLLFVTGYWIKKYASGESATRNHPSLGTDKGEACSAYLYKTATRLSIAFLLIGLAGLSYHTALMGGLIDVIKYAPSVRTGEYRLEGKWLFLRQFSAFASTAFILFWAVYDTKKKPSLGDTGLMLLTTVVFVFFALSTDGRREFWYPVMLCFLVSFVARNGFKFRQLGFLVFAFVLWWGFGSFKTLEAIAPVQSNNPGVSIAGTYFNNVYLSTVQGTADSFMHFVGMQHAKLWQFGFLSDIREIPLQFVPSYLFGFDRGRGGLGSTSEFFLGHPLAQGFSGEEPPGLHGYLLVNFGYFGMFLLFFLLGLAYKQLDNILRPVRRNDAVAWLIYWWIFFMFLEFFREGALILVLKPRASWWLAIGLLIYAKRHFEKNRQKFQFEPGSYRAPRR